jgi:hypothetical protein
MGMAGTEQIDSPRPLKILTFFSPKARWAPRSRAIGFQIGFHFTSLFAGDHAEAAPFKSCAGGESRRFTQIRHVYATRFPLRDCCVELPQELAYVEGSGRDDPSRNYVLLNSCVVTMGRDPGPANSSHTSV